MDDDHGGRGVLGVSVRGDKRRNLLQEAAAFLNERGIAQASLSAIAARLDITRAALYYYVEDQQDLVFQCYLQTCEVMVERLNAATARERTARGVIVAFVDGMVQEGSPELAALNEVAYLREDQRDIVRQRHAEVMDRLRGVLERGIARDQVRSLDSAVVAQATLGLIFWVPLTRRWPTTVGVRRHDLVNGIKTMLLEGLAAERTATFRYEPFELCAPSLPVRDLFDSERLAAAKQEALLAAASWIFNLKGIETTSLEEIAAAMGVTPKVIYHNVGDKETLVTNCYRRAFDFYESLAQRADQYPGSRLEAVCAVAHGLAEATLREELAPLTPVADLKSLPQAAQQEVTEAVTRLLNLHIQMYEQGQDEGSLRPFDIRAVLAVRHATHEWLPKWYANAAPEEKADVPKELAEFTRLGISPI